jgi:uncharacterized protein DUF4349
VSGVEERMDPERLAELVDGAPPLDADEREVVALLEATRELEEGPSAEARRRILGAAEGHRPRPGPRARLADLVTPRRMAVGAPALAAVLAAAIAIPALVGGNGDGGGGGGAPAGSAKEPAVVATPTRRTMAPQAERAATGSGALGAVPGGTPATAIDPRRDQQVTAMTRVQVSGVDRLSRASDAAMATVSRLGGFTASSRYSVPDSGKGTNRLVFRVPVGRAEAAVRAFGRLGTVTGQSASIADLTARVDAATRRIALLADRVADLRAQLAARPGDPDLRARLSEAGRALRLATESRDATLARTRMATLRLTLTTEGPPAPAAHAGRIGGAIGRAGDRLGMAVAWLLGAIVLVGPFLVVAVLAAWGVARLRARAERRLMRAR